MTATHSRRLMRDDYDVLIEILVFDIVRKIIFNFYINRESMALTECVEQCAIMRANYSTISRAHFPLSCISVVRKKVLYINMTEKTYSLAVGFFSRVKSR